MSTIEIGKQKPFIVFTALHIFSACLVLANELLAINNRVPGGNFPIEHKSSWARVILFCSVAVISAVAGWIFTARKDLSVSLPSFKFVLPVAILLTLISVLVNYPSVLGWCCEVYPTRYFGFPFSYLRGDSLIGSHLLLEVGTVIQYRLHFPYQFFLDLLFWSNVAFLVFSLIPLLIQNRKTVKEHKKDIRIERSLLMDRMIRLFLALFFGLIAGLVVFFFPAHSLITSTPTPMPFIYSFTSTPHPLVSNEMMSVLLFQSTPVQKIPITRTPISTTITEGICPDTQPVEVATGQVVMFRLDPSIPGRIHQQPDLQSKVLGRIRNDEFFIIIAGPHCADDLVWWKVQSARGLLGWTAEGYVSNNWIVTPTSSGANPSEPLTPPAANSTPMPTVGSGVELIRMIKADARVSVSVAWSPDGQRLASGGYDGAIRIWDWEFGEEILAINIPERKVSGIAWSPDGQRVASGELVQVRNSSTGELLAKMDIRDALYCEKVQWSHNGRLLAGGCSNGDVFLWEPSTGELLRILQGHVWPIPDIAWSPDDRYIASGSHDGTLRVFDVVNGMETNMLMNEVPDCLTYGRGRTTCSIRSIAWSPDGSQIVFGSDNSAVQIWDLLSGQVRTVGYHTELNDHVNTVAWSPDGRRIVSAGFFIGQIWVWDPAGERPAYMLKDSKLHSVRTIAWSPDGKYLAATGDDLIVIWRIP